ncbi:hypothetical protein EV182_006844 [Spiromyces aspiralis]|uniref:Uncharacterized protein n=1 Tax=Spiromyces aspiralis TaxID=68401 RepID=A0ACC1HB88_9FUNG|nr:hypothetical protein EV182_006844 [Spiromyces aspiralis]
MSLSNHDVNLCSLGFIIGFRQHLKNMFHKVRIVATLIYIITLVLTFVVAFVFEIPAVCLVLVIIQFCALTWYSASYIPFGQKIIKSSCGACLGVV